jgi:hypothetical protein
MDPRHLGVPVHRIVLKGAGAPVEIGPDHPGLTDGFHQDEGTHRWTNGRALFRWSCCRPRGAISRSRCASATIELDYPT